MNGANAFNAGNTAVGAMFIICGLLWFIAIPVAAVLLFLVGGAILEVAYSNPLLPRSTVTTVALAGASTRQHKRQ